MPLSNLKDDAHARLEEWLAVHQRGFHCRQMLADHTSDLVSHLEYGLGKARKKPIRSSEELLHTLRDLHEELVSLMQEVDVKLRELSTATEQVRKLLYRARHEIAARVAAAARDGAERRRCVASGRPARPLSPL